MLASAKKTLTRTEKTQKLMNMSSSKVTETDAQIKARLSERFEILDILAEACTLGNARSLIVSGPAGLGKSYTVEEKLKQWDPSAINHAIIKGYVRATGLIKLLYRFREEGQVLVFDDADAIFFDDISLNILKAACDTTERRMISWLSEGVLVDDDTGETVPKSFEFSGSIIFITNYDFDAMIEKGHKLAPHFAAMISRSHYMDLDMKTKRDYLVRIRQVIAENGLLNFLAPSQQKDVSNFIETHSDRLRELSLRMAIKLGNIRKTNSNWEKIALVTCCKNA